MKIILVTLLCLLFVSTSFPQAPQAGAGGGEKSPAPQTVGVEEVYLAKDDGEGKAGEAAEYFLTTDIPIYCVVQLKSTDPATVRMNLVAVSVKGVKAESRVIAVSYTTNGKQDVVNFTGKPDRVWTAGSYRIDIFIDGKLAGGKSFEIKNSPTEIQNATPAVENFAPPKSKPKPRIVKSTRRN